MKEFYYGTMRASSISNTPFQALSSAAVGDYSATTQIFYDKATTRSRIWSNNVLIAISGWVFYLMLKSKHICRWRPIWRSGGNTRLLRKRSRVWFPHSANICVHEHVCFYWVWVFLCIVCMYLQKKVYQYVFIRYLISAYFGLDSRECKCLEYLEYLFIIHSYSFNLLR
jgi:hypothetical protein